MLHVAHAPCYELPLPPGHRFPMAKYSLIPQQLLHEGTLTPANFWAPQPLEPGPVLAVHQPDYWAQLHAQTLPPKAARRIGFPLSAELVARERVICQGTLQAVQHARRHGVALNVAGGTHHAYTAHGEGFCVFNDIAIAAAHALAVGWATQILVVDLDVHQGNGTAVLFRQEPRVFTFSMHGANNYPLRKEESDLDIPLPDHCDDATYLAALEHHLPRLLDALQPDLIFYQCGVDVLAQDKLGRLGLTLGGVQARDRYVLERARRNGIPLVGVMGGGYPPKLTDLVEAHCSVYRLAQELYF